MPTMPFNGGWRPTGRMRIRNTIFGCKIEEEREYRDGSVKWVRDAFTGPIVIGKREWWCRDTLKPQKEEPNK